MKLLVVAYYFPPYPRVGGRRWAKFCKYLQYAGIDFSVLAAAFSGESVWDKDTQQYESKITRLNVPKIKVPYFQQTLPNNLLQKFKWKLSQLLYSFRCKIKKGNFNDPSYPATGQFEKAIEKKIKEKRITHIVITGGPYHYLKVINSIPKEIKVVLDLRDPWKTDVLGLSQAQVKYEETIKKMALNRVDLITSTETSILNNYNSEKPTFHLPHCIDEEDFENTIQHKTMHNTLVYGGDFYGALEEMSVLDQLIGLLKEDNQQIEGHLYSPMKRAVQKDFKSEHLLLKEALSLNQFLGVIQSSFANVYLNTKERRHFFSTKFFELLRAGRPILYIGLEGDVSNFLEEHKVGFHLRPDNLKQVAENLLMNSESSPTYNLEKHTFKYETQRLINTLTSM